MSRIRVVPALAVGLVTLAGCTSASEGPLGERGGFRVCMPHDSSPAAIGVPLDYTSGPPVTIDHIQPQGVLGLTVEAYVMPVDSRSRVGAMSLPFEGERTAAWDARVPAAGAIFAAGEERELVLVATPDVPEGGGYDTVRLGYSADGRDYVVDLEVAFDMPEGPCA